MRGIFFNLFYLTIAIRAVFTYQDSTWLGLVTGCVVGFGVLLIIEPWLTRLVSTRLKPQTGAPMGQVELPAWYPIAYLVVQITLVEVLLLIEGHYDFFALLYIPLSLPAVLLNKGKIGFCWIAAFIIGMLIPLVIIENEGKGDNLAMIVEFGGLCLVVGSYAHLIRKANVARFENQRLLGELQTAHQQLQGYTSQIEELAVENTRSRLARELHDSVTQTVFSMNLTTQTARMLIDRDIGRVSGQLDRLQELAGNAMKEIHLLVSQLQARTESKEDLTTALQQLFSERLERDGLQVDFQVEGNISFSTPEAVGLFHIIQEALTNVLKHAGTRQVDVRVNGAVYPPFIEIQDHGKGFDVKSSSNQRGHLGMTSMAERAKEIGWNFTVSSQPGAGTRIRVSAPPQEVQP